MDDRASTVFGDLDRFPFRILSWLLLAVAVAVAVHEHWVVPVLPYDDGYISFRYAVNLVAGRGLVYNEGEAVFGSTTPLFVLWLSAIHGLLPQADLPTLAVRTNLLHYLAAAAALWVLVRRITGSVTLASVTAGLMVGDPRLLAISSGGMESFLFLALAFGCLTLIAADRPPWAGVLGGLGLLVRPEAVVLPVLALVRWARRPRRLLGAALAFGGTVLPWIGFATWAYGSPIPHSVVAKAAPLFPLEPGEALSSIWGTTDGWLFGGRGLLLSRWKMAAVGFLSIFAVAGVLRPPESRRSGAWMPALLAALLVAFYGISNPLFFEWYWPLVQVPFLAAWMIGLAAAAWPGEGPSARTLRRRLQMPFVVTSLVVWMVWSAVSAFSRPRDRVVHPISVHQVATDRHRARVKAYVEAARRIAERARPGDVVAAPEIGALGFHYPGPILDTAGLVSPEALPHLPYPPEQREGPWLLAVPSALLRERRPAWLVSMPVFTRRSAEADPWFLETYRVYERIPLPLELFLDRDVVIWRLLEGPPPETGPPKQGTSAFPVDRRPEEASPGRPMSQGEAIDRAGGDSSPFLGIVGESRRLFPGHRHSVSMARGSGSRGLAMPRRPGLPHGPLGLADRSNRLRYERREPREPFLDG